MNQSFPQVPLPEALNHILRNAQYNHLMGLSTLTDYMGVIL